MLTFNLANFTEFMDWHTVAKLRTQKQIGEKFLEFQIKDLVYRVQKKIRKLFLK